MDYSGRSVIVVGPDLKIFQCGLPKEMALELFKPFVMKRLVETQKAANIKEAKKKVDKVYPEVWDALENVIKEHPVLLNRAPTLHRLSIQAFEPILVEGRAIKLHPLVCSAFNADFDGDQMPVHVPLSAEAQAEARFLMLSANNLLKPADGRAVTVPSQDMILGSYYLTMINENEIGAGRIFRDMDEAEMAYANGQLGLHAPIRVRMEKTIDGVKYSKIVDATLGRLIFNRQIPQNLGYVDRSDPDKLLDLEVAFVIKKKQLGKIIDNCIKINGITVAAQMLDNIKATGFKYSTKSGISISVYDMKIPPEKYTKVAEAEQKVGVVTEHFLDGELSEEERYNNVIKIWEQTTEEVTTALTDGFDKFNSLKMIIDSGARGNASQLRQLAGMRGLMFATNGKTMEIPIKSNFREGLNNLEYFIGARGSRKSLSDTALRTADSGYLTRRLVDVSQQVIIHEDDCGTTEGVVVCDIKDGYEIIEPFKDRLVGRYSLEDVVDPTTDEVLVKKGDLISEDQADAVGKSGVEQVLVRSILRCKAKRGVCAHCYGADLASGKKVNVGEAVGIIAAQSIGEPGTQLTMRTFHTGGIAGSDITQGLPRVEELLEARRPKKAAIITEATGTVRMQESKTMRNVVVTSDETGEEFAYPIPFGTRIIVEEGQHVTIGQSLTEGNKAPADILKTNGIEAVYDYIIREVQRVYRLQAVEINDKHVEIIARQMTRKIHIDDAGDTSLLVGTTADVPEFIEENEKIDARIAAGETELRHAEGSPMLLGITKAALMTESFLSAASFQETTKVLTEAAIRGKVDHLQGLKENVIIGKLIPAGTGLSVYNDIEVFPTDAAYPVSTAAPTGTAE